MKRGTPLQRRTPLRTSQQKRTGRRDTGPAKPTRLTVLERDEYRCAVCGQSVLEIPLSLHHRRNRGSGGSSDPLINAPSNLLTVCGTGTTGCHGWIGSSPLEALGAGYVVSLNSREATTDVPVAHAVHGVVYLLDAEPWVMPVTETGGAA